MQFQSIFRSADAGNAMGEAPRAGQRPALGIWLTISIALTASVHAGPFADQTGRLDDPTVASAVVAAGAAALPDVVAALSGDRPDLAVVVLGRMKLPDAAEPLAKLAADPDGQLRASVAWALGQCGGPAAVAPLVRLSTDSYAPARSASLYSLASLQGGEVDSAITRTLADIDPATRIASVQAIAQSNRLSLAPALLPMLDYSIELVPEKKLVEANANNGDGGKLIEQINWKEPSEQVRLSVIRALSSLKYFDALPAMIGAMERETILNRLTIIQSVEAMGDRASSVCIGRIVPLPYDKDAFEKYMPLLINNGTLAVIAGHFGDERAVPFLLETLKLPREKLGADQNLTELYIQTIELLGKFKVVRAARPLVGVLTSVRIKQVASVTQTALRAIGHSAARPLASAAADDWQLAPVLFSLLREPDLRNFAAREAVLKYLSHESDQVRFEATETLGMYLFEGILDEYDMPLLDAMYLDPNREVRASCAKWKQKIAEKQLDGGRS